MSREYPDRSGSLGDFVDGVTLTTQDKETAKRVEKAAQEAWREDNLFAHDYLSRAVDGLNFEGMVARQREVLHDIPSFHDDQMALRTISWIPDSSSVTRDADEPRIRAVHGHAVLLTSRAQGVNGDFRNQNEAADSIFYALGVATEESDQLLFHTMASPDMGQYKPELYHLLTRERYTSAVYDYNASSSYFFSQNSNLKIPLMQMLGEEIPEELLEADRIRKEGYNRQVNGMERSFKRKMREIGEVPTESASHEHTRVVTDLLLGTPQPPATARSILRMSVDLFKRDLKYRFNEGTLPKGYRPPRPQPPTPSLSYAHELKPLFDWEQPLTQQNLALSFDQYLRTNPIITSSARR